MNCKETLAQFFLTFKDLLRFRQSSPHFGNVEVYAKLEATASKKKNVAIKLKASGFAQISTDGQQCSSSMSQLNYRHCGMNELTGQRSRSLNNAIQGEI